MPEGSVRKTVRKKTEKRTERPACPPGHGMMEIKDVSAVDPVTGKVRLSEEAVEKGKEWTEFTKL